MPNEASNEADKTIEEIEEEQRIVHAAVGGWMHTIVGRLEIVEENIVALTAQLQRLTAEVARLQSDMGVQEGVGS